MKIFLIDDDRLSILVTKTLLELEGATRDITAFLDASEALDVLHTSSAIRMPDVILLDLNMPVMDGWDFLDAVASLDPKLNKKCKIYILTSSLDTSDANRVKDYPIVAGFIHKPLKSEDIRIIVSEFNL